MTGQDVVHSRFTLVRELLKIAAGGDAVQFGGLALWTFSRTQLLSTTLGNLPLISLPGPKKSCCSAPAFHGGEHQYRSRPSHTEEREHGAYASQSLIGFG
jgi:hypothetical protein